MSDVARPNIGVGTQFLLRRLEIDATTVALCGALIVSRLVALACFPVFDDAFITFRYAQNLVAGHGYLYNAGDWVLGTTAPLFGLIAALIIALGAAPELVIPPLNIGFDLGIALLARELMFKGDRRGFACFIACFALSPMLARVTIGAMEVDLFVFCGLGAFVLYQRQRVFLAVALGATAYFLRPEAVLIVAVLCLAEMFLAREPLRAMAMGALALAVVTPGLVTMQLVYGHFLSQSVLAKSAHAATPPLSVLQQLLAPEPISGAIAVVGLVGVVLALCQRGVARLLAGWLLLYLAAYMLGGPKIWSWYDFMPLTVATMFAGYAASKLSARWRLRHLDWAVAAAVIAGWAMLGLWRYPDRITRNIYEPLASVCADTSASDTILASDIGIVGYRCPGFIEDAAALVWPPAKDYRTEWEIVAATKPSYLFLNVTGSMLQHMSSAPLASVYRPVRRFAADGNPDPAAARNLGADWAQEYVLYRRVAQ
jgi:hypothetical protein